MVDFSRVLAGPWATQHLADQGADVVKVEPPDGDETRRFGPIVDGVSTYFLSCNRNKRSIVLDLRTDAGREVARALAARADVLVHNWRPGADARLGMDWPTVSRVAPRLVYVAIAAFGADAPEPWPTRAGYDLVLQAMGGAMSFTGFPGARSPDAAPIRAGTPIADLVTGLLVVQAALHGLLQRERTGLGQRIEVNMMQAQAASLVYHATRFSVTGEREERRGNEHAGLVPYDVFPCGDGWVAIACGNDGLWAALCEALGIEPEPGWSTNPGRVADRRRVNAAVVAALSGLSPVEAEDHLCRAGVPAGRVLDVADAFHHPAVTRATFVHPQLGAVEAPGPVLRTAATREVHTPPPALGADRDAVLGELGYDEAAIRGLGARGAFGGRH